MVSAIMGLDPPFEEGTWTYGPKRSLDLYGG